MVVWFLISPHCQSGLSGAKSSGRSMAKEFVFDYSYWSVSTSDDHYADQEQVSHMNYDVGCSLHICIHDTTVTLIEVH